MPVSVESGISGPFFPNGVTTTFPFSFKAVDVADVVVLDGDLQEVSSSLYAVALNTGEGGTVTFTSAPSAVSYPEIYIASQPTMTQSADFGNSGPSFNPAILTQAFDKAAIRDIYLLRLILNANGESGAPGWGGGSGGGISPMSYGAVGNGVTNDRAAIISAINAAIDGDTFVDGGDNLYGVNADILIEDQDRVWIRRLRLKSTAPSSNRRLLHFLNCPDLRIDGLYIHNGDDPTSGERDVSNALRVESCSRPIVKNVEITGSGKGTMIMLWRCTDAVLEKPYVHDIDFSDSSVSSHDARLLVEDDVLEGIRIQDCKATTVNDPVVRDLTGNGTFYTQSGYIPGDSLGSEVKAFPNMRTRGLSGGGNDTVTINNPIVWNTDQAIDFSGSGEGWGNKKLIIKGGHTFNCGSVGVKWGGFPSDCLIEGHIAENCGMMCYLIGGYREHDPLTTHSLIGCLALNPGYNDIQMDHGDFGGLNYLANGVCGYQVFAPYDYGVQGVTLSACRAIDRQGLYLFGDDPTADVDRPWPTAASTTAHLLFPWTGYTDSDYQLTFNTAGGLVTKTCTLTAGSTVVTLSSALGSAVDHPFVAMPPKMQYGYMCFQDNDGTYVSPMSFSQTTKRPNVLGDDCESHGHLIARQYGFHFPVCYLTASDTPAVPNNDPAYFVPFNVEAEDTLGMHSTSADTDRIYPKLPGIYRVRAAIYFATNTTGIRSLDVCKNGASLHSIPASPLTGTATPVQVDYDVVIEAADVAANAYINLSPYQNSGGSLNLTNNRWIKVERVRPL